VGEHAENDMFRMEKCGVAFLLASVVGLACGGSGHAGSNTGSDGGGGASAGTGGCGNLCVSSTGGNWRCGDGVWDVEMGEQCDDGNRSNGDGCNFVCQIEANWICPIPGQPCVEKKKCGNGLLNSDESCDDGNRTDDDGCSADCQTIESGWWCRVPGKPCAQLCDDIQFDGGVTCSVGNGRCGDGLVTAGEECDCGDGTVPVPKVCPEPNNDDIYGGCTTQCTWGPFCGDGIAQSPQEQCDLGEANGSDLSPNGCLLGCLKPHYCGDGILDTDRGEYCDLGQNNGVPLDDNGYPSPNGWVICSAKCKISLGD
jgi:cysteine-rich repeat protein